MRALSAGPWSLAGLAVAGLAALAAACSSTEGVPEAYLARAINLVSDSPGQAIDIGSLSFETVFGSGTGYSSGFPEAGAIEVRAFVPAAGASPGDPFEDTLILKAPESVDFASGTSYTLITYGTVSDFRSMTLTRPADTTPDTQNTSLQFVHAALGAGGVDIYVTAPDADLPAGGPDVSLTVGTVADALSLPSGDYRLRITAAGDATVIFDSGPITPLPSGYLLAVVGKSVGPVASPVFLSLWQNQGAPFALADISTPAFARLLHLSPDAGRLDLYAEDDYSSPLAADVGYAELSAYGEAADTLPDGPSVVPDRLVDFAASAADAEDGDLTGSILWSSSIDGDFADTGGTLSTALSSGIHAITASVTDAGGLTASGAVTVTVLSSDNVAPVVDIRQPPSGTVVAAGTAVALSATATDETDGDLGDSIVWTSSIDGPLTDTGADITATLSAGTHAVTASATDGASLQGSDTVLIRVTTNGNAAPEVTISAPDLARIEMDVTPAGDPATLIRQESLEIFSGSAYTYVLSGEAAALRSTLLADAVQNVATHSLLRLVNASESIGAFDVYVTAPGEGIADKSAFFSAVGFGGGSVIGPLAAGTYDLTLTATGTGTVAFVIPSVSLDNGQINTLVVLDDTGTMMPDFVRFID